MPLILILVAYLLTGTLPAHGSPEVNPVADSALALIVGQHYRQARTMLEKALERNFDDMDAQYLLLTVKQTELLDYESYGLEGGQFIEAADSVCRHLTTLLKNANEEDSLRYLFYLGNIYGGKGLILAKNGDWVAGTKWALASVSILKTVKRMAPTFYAAYLGTGVFNYYLSQNLKWVPFLGDRSQEGIADVRKSTQARFPFNYAGRNSLAWILIDQGRLDEAERVVDDVLNDFPDNTIFLRIKARIAFWRQEYDEAALLGRRLTTISLNRSPVNWSDILTGLQISATSYIALGRTDELRERLDAFGKLEIPPQARKIPNVKSSQKYLRDMVVKEKIVQGAGRGK